jgi:hypothetical protein
MSTPRTRRASSARPSPRTHQSPPAPSSAPEARTRLIRFRLNPRSSSDQHILTWLLQHAPYYRADAIRTALLTHILRRNGNDAPASSSPGVNTAPSSSPPGTHASAVQKLEKLFPS